MKQELILEVVVLDVNTIVKIVVISEILIL